MTDDTADTGGDEDTSTGAGADTDTGFWSQPVEDRYRTLWKAGGPAVLVFAVLVMTSANTLIATLGLYLVLVAVTMTVYAYKPGLFEEHPQLDTVKNVIFLSVVVIIVVGVIGFSLYVALT